MESHRNESHELTRRERERQYRPLHPSALDSKGIHVGRSKGQGRPSPNHARLGCGCPNPRRASSRGSRLGAPSDRGLLRLITGRRFPGEPGRHHGRPVPHPGRPRQRRHGRGLRGGAADPRRRAALKIIRGPHHADEFHVRMFHREAELLGRLRHPNIAAIYESGHTDEGRHFFAMELVNGETLDAYWRRLDEAAEDSPRARKSANDEPSALRPIAQADFAQRLRLFLKICDAVNCAHQRRINFETDDGDRRARHVRPRRSPSRGEGAGLRPGPVQRSRRRGRDRAHLGGHREGHARLHEPVLSPRSPVFPERHPEAGGDL